MKYSLLKALKLATAAALALVLLALLASWEITRQLREDVADPYRDGLNATVHLSEANSALWRLRYGFDQYLNGDAAIRRRVLDEETQWYSVIEGRLAAFARLEKDPDDLLLLADLNAAYLRYKEARPKFFELVAAGRIEDAQAWRTLTTTPFGAATVAAFESLIAEHRLDSDVLQRRAAAVSARARWLVPVSDLALLVLLLGGYFSLRYNLLPMLALRARAMQALSEVLGEQAELKIQGSNEIVAVQACFDLLLQRFSLHIEDLHRAQTQLTEQQVLLEQTVAERTAQLQQTLAQREQQSSQIALRSELSELLQSCQDSNEAGRIAETYLQRLFPTAAGALYLSDEERKCMKTRAAVWGAAEQRPARQEFEFVECWAMRRGKPHSVAGSDASKLCAHLSQPAPAASLCLPLTAHGEAIGLLQLVSAEDQPGADWVNAELAESTATLLALAFSNLELRESLRLQSIRDALTGLYNRRYLEATLPREIARAARAGQSFAVLMLDVDHFKDFNDLHGHEAGDAVLRAVGRMLQDNCRQGDSACRFGGEEFTILLPDIDSRAAREWGERLRRRVAALEIRYGAVLMPPVFISLGLALYPEHGRDTHTLLQAVDLALYDAKNAGRDCLVVSGQNHQNGNTP